MFRVLQVSLENLDFARQAFDRSMRVFARSLLVFELHYLGLVLLQL